MASSEDRIKQLFQEQLGRPANPAASVADSGVSSLDAVAFIKAVGEEFGVTIPPEEVAKFTTLGDLIAYVDSHSG